MRKWHRWLSIVFGVFGLWITITGILSQAPVLGDIVSGEQGRPQAEPAAPAGFSCPESMTCRPKRSEKASLLNVGLIHQLHSGEKFGPLGTIVMSLTGLAMLFFAFSGLWMYIAMWRNRAARDLKPGWYWK